MRTEPNLFSGVAAFRLMRQRVSSEFRDDTDNLGKSFGLDEVTLPRLLKFSMLLFSFATFAFLLWAGFTPVKELARTEGQVVPAGYSQTVQHLEGGLVQEILVQEGDFVQKDQILARLDGAGTEEDMREQRALVQTLALQAEKLHALIEDREPDFSHTNATEKQIAEQMEMYKAMRDARNSERNVLREQIAQRRQSIGRLKELHGTASANLAVAEESKGIYEGLEKKGMASRASYLAKQQEYNSRVGEAASYGKQTAEARAELSEYERRLSSLMLQQKDSTYTELNRVESELTGARENLKKREGRVTRLEVRSPVMGYVKGLKLNTIGSVIPPGQTLMEIVPVEEQLVVEVRIPTKEIGRVAVGQKVQVKVDSYDYVRYGTIEGEMKSISAMTFTDDTRNEYYKGRVYLARNYLGSVPGRHKVIPGMTVDADVVVGEKTVLAYLLKPIRSAIYNSFTEQ